MKKSLVSIIIPVYNGEKFIKRAIDSCLNQTYQNIEILVVDNESTDNTENVLSSIADSRLKILHSKKGRSIARNKGIRESQGEYIVFLDADDQLSESRVERGVYILEKNLKYFASATCIEYIDDRSKKSLEKRKPHYKTCYDMIQKNPFPINSIMMRADKSVFFDESLENNEDWLYFAMLLKDKFVYIDDSYIGGYVYIHENNTMADFYNMIEHQIYVKKKIEEFYDVSKLFNFQYVKLYLILLSDNLKFSTNTTSILFDFKFGNEYRVAKVVISIPFLNKYIISRVNLLIQNFNYV